MSFASLRNELNVSRSRAESSVSSCKDAGVAISELAVGWRLSWNHSYSLSKCSSVASRTS